MINQRDSERKSPMLLKIVLFLTVALLSWPLIFSSLALAQRGGPPGHGPYIWQEGRWIHHPAPPPPGHRWRSGHWRGHVWVNGHWVKYRAPSRYHVWRPGHWRGHVWIEGHWRRPHHRYYRR